MLITSTTCYSGTSLSLLPDLSTTFCYILDILYFVGMINNKLKLCIICFIWQIYKLPMPAQFVYRIADLERFREVLAVPLLFCRSWFTCTPGHRHGCLFCIAILRYTTLARTYFSRCLYKIFNIKRMPLKYVLIIPLCRASPCCLH